MLRTIGRKAAPAEAAPLQLPAAPAATAVATIARPFIGRMPYAPLRQSAGPWRLLSFAALVLLPVALAALYYVAFAADQYVAEFRISLRTVDTPSLQPVVLLGNDIAHGNAATESQIVTQYIASRAIVDELDPKLDLRGMFARREADFWARLSLPASIEQLVRYWRGQVDPFYDTSTGTIVVRVQAFTPADALNLAQAVVAASERLVNDLSARARHDAVADAEKDVAGAEARLRTALTAIRQFRDQAGTIDPAKAADATGGLATRLRDDLIKANAELATLKTYMSDNAPAVRVVTARIRSLEVQQRALAAEMTAAPAAPPPSQAGVQPVAPPAPASALSGTMASYEALDAERKFAETAYQHALEGLDRARDEANRQHVYIESFVPPSLPETALYPHRWRMIGTVGLLAFALWAIGGLAVQSIREHL